MSTIGTEAHHGALADDPEARDRVATRLKRIEGQVRGIHRMIDEGRYCPDILTQIASVHAALRGVGKVLMRSHLQHCVTDALRSGDPVAAERTYDEVMELMYRHVRE
jgi:DNA-binding FrmR family transcriptional regulator